MLHTWVQTSTGTCACVRLPGCRCTHGYRNMQCAHRGVHTCVHSTGDTNTCMGAGVPRGTCTGVHTEGCTHGCTHGCTQVHAHGCAMCTRRIIPAQGTMRYHATAPSLPCSQGPTGPQNSQGTSIPHLWVRTGGHWQLMLGFASFRTDGPKPQFALPCFEAVVAPKKLRGWSPENAPKDQQ